MTRAAVIAVATVVAASVLALAVSPAARAQPLSREELEAALAQRDQVIAALEKRVEALEAARGSAQATPIATTPAAGAPATGVQSPASDAGGASDDEAALQALSRGLVQRGLVLLPTWSVEVTPSVSYSHSQQQGLALVDTPEGISTVDSQRQRDDDADASLSARVGLPWRSQLQVTLPYDWRRDSSALGDGTEVTHSDTHVGDVQVELSHQFLVESGWRPDLIAAVSWRAPTGRDPYKVPVAAIANGLGTNQVTGRITVLKTVDPLVLYSSVSYSANLPYKETFGQVHVGDAIDWQMGALLAVSPETSLSFGFTQEFKSVTRVDGARIPGSDGVAAVAQIGLDQVINERTLVDISLGIGVTKDAPDYQVMVSIPVRFR